MAHNILERYFGIKPEKALLVGNQTRYLFRDTLYTIVPVADMEQEVLIELYEMSEHMAKIGDRKTAVFIPASSGSYLVSEKDAEFTVLKNEYRPIARKRNIGRSLARFHLRGQTLEVQMKSVSRLGNWRELWGRRLDQMEKVWMGTVQERPSEPFTELFADSFPYFMGLAENAIQYVADTELDEEPGARDRGAICHERFSEAEWETGIRDPFGWVYDHPARDVAEWARAAYFRNSRTLPKEMDTFFGGYQSLMLLSPFFMRLVYARLLFPLHYFETVEEYFGSDSFGRRKELEERLHVILRDTREYEGFLASFFSLAKAGGYPYPVPEWL